MRQLARCLLLLLATLVIARPVAAGDAGLTNTETFSGFQFNFNNPGARALGMGGAFVAVADDATAVVANPAGLTILQRPEISAEYKYTRFRNTINAFTNTPTDGATNTVHDRDFDDSVNTPSFFSFVYPTERVVLAAFVRELINYKSTFNTNGVFLTDPTDGSLQRLLPVKSDLEITAVNFGQGAAVNLEKENPLLPNVGVSFEFKMTQATRLELEVGYNIVPSKDWKATSGTGTPPDPTLDLSGLHGGAVLRFGGSPGGQAAAPAVPATSMNYK